MIAATTGMVLLSLSLTVFAGPLFDLANRAAVANENHSNYVDAVFPGGVE